MHISLDQALGRQPRLNRVGQSLLNIGSGASAAYSLRSLTGGDPKVVNVRRDADDEEREFTASGVNAELENWVNGKLETTLPADVDTAAAAYSLRKVRSAYTGNAVKIRRESDDAEADVTFDDNDEVSTSSAITVTSGSSTATTLGEFIDSEKTGRINFASGSNDWLSYDDSSPIFRTTLYGTGTIRSAYNHITDLDEIGASPVSDSDYSFKVDSATGTSGHAVSIGANSSDYSYTCTFKYYVPVGQPDIQIVYGTVSSGSLSVKGQWEEVTVSSDASQGHRSFLVRSAAHSSTGGIWYLADLNLEISSYNASVVTWYDQSGNGNDATQDVAASQPLIAENGNLLADGIEFDGVDDMLQTGTTVINQTNAGTISHFGVAKADSDAGYLWGSAGNTSSLGTSLYNRTTEIEFSQGSDVTKDSIAKVGGTELISACYSSNDANLRINGGGTTIDGGTYSFTVNDEFTIGNREGGSSSGTYLNGSIQEIIVFNSDQSSNRFKIESNINNHYGIYTAAEDGFVETWYDQSGSGNNAATSTADQQPYIVQNGSVVTNTNGDPSILSVRSSTEERYLIIDSALDPMDSTHFAVVDYSRNFSYHLTSLSGGSSRVGRYSSDQFRLQQGGTAVTSTSTDFTQNAVHLATVNIAASGGTSKAFLDGAEVISNIYPDSTADYKQLFRGDNDQGGGLKTSEFVFYDSDETGKRSDLETNIASHYDITLS